MNTAVITSIKCEAVPFIKAWRTFTNCSLKEGKDIWDQISSGHPYTYRGEISQEIKDLVSWHEDNSATKNAELAQLRTDIYKFLISGKLKGYEVHVSARGELMINRQASPHKFVINTHITDYQY